MAPFRWDITRREQLGSWIENVPGFRPMRRDDLETLRITAARVLAMSEAAHLAFIGRTPEHFYDYLSGCFEGKTGLPDISLVPFSMRWLDRGGAAALPAHKLAGLASALAATGLEPARIARSDRPVALVDAISYGGTMQALIAILHRIAGEHGVDWNSVQRRLMIIGLRPRTKNSPNTWRWQQRQNWLDLIPDTTIRNVSVDEGFLFLLAAGEDKVTRSFHSGRWDDETEGASPPDDSQRLAMKMAAFLYDLGATREERERLAALIARQPQMKSPAVRHLVLSLRRS